MELTAGTVISSRYRLLRLLGEGGMGAVWAASHLVTRKQVALKFLKSAGVARPEVLRRFLREARAASAVKHPNVVQIHDIVQTEEGLPVMVMDFLDGESLGERLERERSIPLPELARILVPVLSAVGTAHSLGIVHRDLKPDNIFLVKMPGGATEPRVLDFGIAKLSSDEGDAAKTSALTKTGSMLGTPYYMSPEQAFGEKDVDHRADIWAMGVIVYECLAGRRPVDGDNFGQLLKVITTGAIPPLAGFVPGLPAEMADLVGRMLTTDRAARCQTLEEPLAVLRRYTDASATSFPPPQAEVATSVLPPVDPSTDAFARTKPVGEGRRAGPLAAVAAVAVLGVAGMVAYRSRSGPAAAAAFVPVDSYASAASSVPSGVASSPRAELPVSTAPPAAPSAASSVAVAKGAVAKGAASSSSAKAAATKEDSGPKPAEAKPAGPSPPALPGGMQEKPPF